MVEVYEWCTLPITGFYISGLEETPNGCYCLKDLLGGLVRYNPGATIQNCLIAAAGGGGMLITLDMVVRWWTTVGGNSGTQTLQLVVVPVVVEHDTGSGGTSDPHPDAVNGGLF